MIDVESQIYTPIAVAVFGKMEIEQKGAKM